MFTDDFYTKIANEVAKRLVPHLGKSKVNHHEEIWTVPEVVRRFKLPRDNVYAAYRNGEIRGIQVDKNGKICLFPESVIEYIESLTDEVPA